MCISATVVIAGAMLASAAASAGTQIMTASAQGKNAAYQAKVKQKELTEKAQIVRLQAIQKENAAANDFEERRSRQMAAMALSQGFNGENISFFQGINPEEEKQFGQTSLAIRLGLATEESAIKDQVQITDFGKDIAMFNSKTQMIGAGAQFVGDAASAASFYKKYG